MCNRSRYFAVYAVRRADSVRVPVNAGAHPAIERAGSSRRSIARCTRLSPRHRDDRQFPLPGRMQRRSPVSFSTATGAVVPDALVAVSGPSPATIRESPSPPAMAPLSLPACHRETIVSPSYSAGLGSYLSPEIQLGAGDLHEIPRVILPIAPTNIDVRVTVTEVRSGNRTSQTPGAAEGLRSYPQLLHQLHLGRRPDDHQT